MPGAGQGLSTADPASRPALNHRPYASCHPLYQPLPCSPWALLAERPSEDAPTLMLCPPPGTPRVIHHCLTPALSVLWRSSKVQTLILSLQPRVHNWVGQNQSQKIFGISERKTNLGLAKTSSFSDPQSSPAGGSLDRDSGCHSISWDLRQSSGTPASMSGQARVDSPHPDQHPSSSLSSPQPPIGVPSTPVPPLSLAYLGLGCHSS